MSVTTARIKGGASFVEAWAFRTRITARSALSRRRIAMAARRL